MATKSAILILNRSKKIICSILILCLFVYQVAAVAVPYSVEQRITQYGVIARNRWKPFFDKAKVIYPPKEITLLALKEERTLEIYALDSNKKLQFIRSIPICAQSGVSGPKLREGDGQVPEGIYKIALLNPNSSYHLSLRIDYPNKFDRTKAVADGRSRLGGDIMIHGNCVSIGCLAMRNEPAEDLFVLAADTKITNMKVVLAPFDFRNKSPLKAGFKGLPKWTPELYDIIQKEFDKLPNRIIE